MGWSISPMVMIPLLTVIILGVLAQALRRSRPAMMGDEDGTISPDKVSAWFTVIVGALMTMAGWALAVFGHAAWLGLALSLMGLAIAGFMAPSLTSMHNVHWTAVGIEGPCKLFGPTLGKARTIIPWSDVVRTGTTMTGYWYVQGKDGRRVYWSYLYKGYGALASVLRLKCPDLTPPARTR
jgi:hypothetical protein